MTGMSLYDLKEQKRMVKKVYKNYSKQVKA